MVVLAAEWADSPVIIKLNSKRCRKFYQQPPATWMPAYWQHVFR